MTALNMPSGFCGSLFEVPLQTGKILCKRQRLPAFRTAKNPAQDLRAPMKSMNGTRRWTYVFILPGKILV
jgi:hypothetical protein